MWGLKAAERQGGQPGRDAGAKEFEDRRAETPEASARATRRLAAWEIVSVALTALIGEWLVFSTGGGDRRLVLVPVVVTFVYLSLSHRLWGESARDLGWRFDNFGAAMRLLLPAMLTASALLVLYGYARGSLNFLRWSGGQSVFGVPALGFLWGLMQQYVLQAFINRRAQVVFGRGARSVLLVAFVFGALHLPNPALTAATFAGGLLWAWAYQRAPNLPALALSHTVMTWVLVSTVPGPLLHGLRVGYKFFG